MKNNQHGLVWRERSAFDRVQNSFLQKWAVLNSNFSVTNSTSTIA